MVRGSACAVLFGSYLIITKIEDVYEVSLPPAIKEILGMLSVGVSFGFDGVSTVLECLGVGSGNCSGANETLLRA